MSDILPLSLPHVFGEKDGQVLELVDIQLIDNWSLGI